MKNKSKIIIPCIFALCLCAVTLVYFFAPNLFSKDSNGYSQAYIEYLQSEDKSSYGDLVPLKHEIQANNVVEKAINDSYYCLRDELMIYTTNQANYGICWAHASSLSLETLYAKKFHEFIDLSEAWISIATKVYHDNHDYENYVLGGGGNVDYFHDTALEYGLMLESDFPLDEYYLVNSNNYMQAFNLYSKYAFDDLGFQLNYENYTTRNAMKQHLLKYGSLYASINSSNIVNQQSLNSTSKKSTHAISVIGWDDEYIADGWTQAGAWIALNSWGDNWGNDGIFYISYNDYLANSVMHGYTFTEPETKVEIISSNSNYENRINGKYNSISSSSATTFDNKNIFTNTQNIQLIYGFDQTLFTETKVAITKDNNLVQNSLTSFNIDQKNGIVSLTATNLEAGTYKLDFTFTTVSGAKKSYVKTFIVLDGLEIGFIRTSSTSTTSSMNFDEESLFYTNFNSYNKENLYFEIYTTQYAYLYLNLPTYSYLSSIETKLDEGSTCNTTYSKYKKYSTNDYSNGQITFNFYIEPILKAEYSVKIILKGLGSQQKEISLKIKNYSFSYQDLTYTHINMNYNGLVDNKTVPSMMVLTTNRKSYLPTLTQGSALFNGYYTTPDFKEESKVSQDEKGYYLFAQDALISYGSNYTTNSSNKYINYLYLYAKWTSSNVFVTFIYDNQTEVQEIPYGSDAKTPTTITCEEGYEIVWNKNFSHVVSDMTVEGTKKLVQSNITSLKINDLKTNKLKTVYDPYNLYTLSVQANHVLPTVSLTYSWKYCNLDEKVPNKKLSHFTTSNNYNIWKASHSGKYIVEIQAKDKLGYTSITTSQEFVINIQKAETIIDTIGILKEYTYNGKFQTVQGASINHSEGKVEYQNNIFKDVGSGKKTVTIFSRETENYKSATTTVDVNVYPANIIIKLDNKRGALYSEKEDFTYEVISGEVHEDLDLDIYTDASMLFAGNFDINAISNNTNYNVKVIKGNYSVYIEGLSIVLIISLVFILAGAVGLLVYIIIKNLTFKRYIKTKKIDHDVDNL